MRTVGTLGIFLLAAALLFSGCARRGEPSSAPEPPAAQAPVPAEAAGSEESPQPGDEAAQPELLPPSPVLLQLREPEVGDPVATISTNKGEIQVVLYPDQSPLAVENFTGLSQLGYYNGKIFHRVVADTLIQGGSPLGDGIGGESVFKDEQGNSLPFDNEFSVDLWPLRGALCMANAGRDTNLSQFFLIKGYPVDEAMAEKLRSQQIPQPVVEAYRELGGMPHLYPDFTVFGQMIGGMEVLEEILAVETDEDDRPLEDVTILAITIGTYPAG